MRRPNRKPNYAKTENIANWSESAEYVIHKEGDVYIAVNGQTGVEDSRSTNPSTAIQYALDTITAGNIVVNTDISNFTTTLTGVNNCILDFLNHTVTMTADVDFITNTQQNHFTMRNLYLIPTANYTGAVITLIASVGNIRWNLFENIYVHPPDTARTYIGIYWHITGAGGNITRCTFRNIDLQYPDTGILFDFDDAGAWATANHFDGVFIREPLIGVDWDLEAGADWNNNFLEKVSIQCVGATTTHGFKDIIGTFNTFIHCVPYDWVAAGTIPASIPANTNRNIFLGCGFTRFNIVDAGTYNLFTDGGRLSIAAINPGEDRDVILFQGSGANPQIWMYGDEAGTGRYTSFQMQATGAFILTNQRGQGTFQLQATGVCRINHGNSADVKIGDGTGIPWFGTYNATPAADSTGYITIKDAAGNTRKLMVQA